MSKDDYSIFLATKQQIVPLMDFHYLSKEAITFRSGFNVGLFCQERNEQDGLFELSRFVLHPQHQQKEHNLASWFLARSVRFLIRQQPVRAVLSYADTAHHNGTLYKACNFDYYGLSDKKSDFWFRQKDGSFKKHSRGTTKGLDGEWRPRSRKHRFLKVFDKNLKCFWNKEVN